MIVCLEDMIRTQVAKRLSFLSPRTPGTGLAKLKKNLGEVKKT